MNRDQIDPEQAERVRQIQEEIRRKIAARRGQPPPPPPPLPDLAPFNPLRPVFSEQTPPSRQAPPLPPPVQPAERDAASTEDAAALDRQMRMAEQLSELENRRRETRRAAQAFVESGETRVSGGVAAERSEARSVGDELRDPRALRRAMVLREVLGAPVALR